MKALSKASALISIVVLLALFNVVVFVLDIERTDAFWAIYIFTTLAILLQYLFYELSFGKAENLKTIFMGYPIAYLGSIYLILQFIFTAIVLISGVFTLAVTVVISALLLGLILTVLVPAYFTRGVIEQTEDQVKVKRQYLSSLQVELEVLAEKAGSPDAKKALNEFAEALRYSDPVSHPDLAGLEAKIAAGVYDLNPLVESNSTEAIIANLTALTQHLTERNKKTKMMK